MDNVNIFGKKFFVVLVAVLIAVGFAANAYQTGVQEVNSFAASHSDDLLNGNLGREILNK